MVGGWLALSLLTLPMGTVHYLCMTCTDTCPMGSVVTRGRAVARCGPTSCLRGEGLKMVF